jgi:hypothetical protein
VVVAVRVEEEDCLVMPRAVVKAVNLKCEAKVERRARERWDARLAATRRMEMETKTRSLELEEFGKAVLMEILGCKIHSPSVQICRVVFQSCKLQCDLGLGSWRNVRGSCHLPSLPASVGFGDEGLNVELEMAYRMYDRPP